MAFLEVDFSADEQVTDALGAYQMSPFTAAELMAWDTSGLILRITLGRWVRTGRRYFRSFSTTAA